MTTKTSKINHLKSLLQEYPVLPEEKRKVFFKTGVGHYAERDQFIGINVPTLRLIAKKFSDLKLDEIQILIESAINEERLIALFILISQYEKSKNEDDTKDQIYKFYLSNLHHVNNWNLVDASAHLILGAHIHSQHANEAILFTLAKSKVLWERRIAMVATWYFIRKNNLKLTFTIAEMLLNDSHDLIHKAVGWMLREAGKKDSNLLVAFLDKFSCKMPRTMLRYSIEKFPEDQRKQYLTKR